MKLQQDDRKEEQPCEPEWVALNHLFSYCAKAGPARAANGDADADDGKPRCTRKSCLFATPRR